MKIFVLEESGERELLVTPITGRVTAEDLDAMWKSLEAAQASRDHYVICSVCARLVETDPRGDVLDSSGRCDTCRP